VPLTVPRSGHGWQARRLRWRSAPLHRRVTLHIRWRWCLIHGRCSRHNHCSDSFSGWHRLMCPTGLWMLTRNPLS